ncbi:tRNA-uridine aminocarboxypropyltransferase [Oceanispirochaeta sp. M1]|uniref:tRNA-uridine aminocarboxypropyltransferase n=1 Tax=Oceanispirochaeta sp. M1 TaxID=2283433 RepID=UPI000E08F84D|nr:tRNA-uridine aminocarboxypropyltransferase [Oceanispirochaeta sp. M1]MBF9018188.1 DTW domain-containing protein [Oceanispirochaeta sp. M2]NPD74629.1 DTW domain-containing protein [Oceanispirochaeta sp. M1]RDG29530.1 DTW domain-containing protein [Oceanispirochaeta sp. M1]
MKIHLLTHQKELKRPTNTAALVVKTLGSGLAEQILWGRKNPDQSLLDSIARGRAVLLYKDSEEKGIEDLSEIDDFIILDGTWQEARKIYNKSPYLHGVKTFSFSSQSKSKYNIRRNQKEGGLCTAECVIELLKMKGESQKAEKLNTAFLEFLKAMITRVVVLSSPCSPEVYTAEKVRENKEIKK